MKLSNRPIGEKFKSLIIAQIGINHQGSVKLAKKLIDKAKTAGCECVKFQSHNVKDEMIKTSVKPGNSNRTIWNIVKDASLSFDDEIKLKNYTEKKGMIYLSTPFSREAANRLNDMDVCGFKIGSGECNNYPLIEHISRMGKPIILSTGMNNIKTIKPAVKIMRDNKVKFALLQCTSMYPTPFDKVNINGMFELKKNFNNCPVGLSDHTLGMDAMYLAISLGATIVEKHFTIDRRLEGPDMNVSMNPKELEEIIKYSSNVKDMMIGQKKMILPEEKPTIRFAYASVVSIKNIEKNEKFSLENIWLKRPGIGDFFAKDFKSLIGKKSKRKILKNSFISKKDF